jgi:hypothetical protein
MPKQKEEEMPYYLLISFYFKLIKKKTLYLLINKSLRLNKIRLKIRIRIP